MRGRGAGSLRRRVVGWAVVVPAAAVPMTAMLAVVVPAAAGQDVGAVPCETSSPAGGAAGPEVDTVLERARNAYDSLRSLRARFHQVTEMTVFDPPRRREGRGIWYQRRPDLFRMDFTEPEGDLIVSDGTHLWLYYPSTHPGQVIRSTLGTGGQGAEVVDLQGRIFRQARTHFVPRLVGPDTVDGRPVHLLRFEARPGAGTPYSLVRAWVDRKSYLVRRLEFTDRSETVKTITLRHLEPNVTLADSLFRFRPPEGTEVFSG